MIYNHHYHHQNYNVPFHHSHQNSDIFNPQPLRPQPQAARKADSQGRRLDEGQDSRYYDNINPDIRYCPGIEYYFVSIVDII